MLGLSSRLGPTTALRAALGSPYIPMTRTNASVCAKIAHDRHPAAAR
ncbi:hypothetical protein [Allochromatium warmingii]|nr:hypothetical protein [Allochromatium warmingii]